MGQNSELFDGIAELHTLINQQNFSGKQTDKLSQSVGIHQYSSALDVSRLIRLLELTSLRSANHNENGDSKLCHDIYHIKYNTINWFVIYRYIILASPHIIQSP